MRKITFITLMMILGMSSVISSCDNSSNNKKNVSNLYKWELPEGVKWKTFGVGEEQVQYEGETKNGLPHGLGYTYDVDKRDVYYHGEWVKGKYHGHGKHYYPSNLDGKMYVGEFKNGLPNGEGTLIFPSGGKYVGEFKDGKQNGQGTYTYGKGKKEGQQITGEFKNGRYVKKLRE